jgi:hypothetical protein
MYKTIISHFYNEEYLLPWWLEHHKKYFNHGIMINYASTDNSVSIIRQACPDWTVINSRNKFFDAKLIDDEVSDIESNVKKDKAASKAGWIMKQTKLDTHPYLVSKGFPNETGHVWMKDGEPLLVIPMSVNRRLVGCQLIKSDGDKKFLYGQTTKNAIFAFDAKGIPFFCEGYATALSVRQVLKASNVKYCIYVCFSASNLIAVADQIQGKRFIYADHDESQTGQKSAESTGLPWTMSETMGFDANDDHKKGGLFSVVKKIMDLRSKVLTAMA